MPQFDPSSFLSQIFWLVICFMSLWGCLHWMIVPKFLSIKEGRKKSLDDLIQQAKATHLEAEALMKQNELRQEQTRQEARHIIQRASVEGELLVRKAIEDLRRLYDQRIQNFHHQLTQTNQFSHKKNLIPELSQLLLSQRGLSASSAEKEE
jgi:F-type H+-transporting ATPase subunit b